MEHKFKDKIDQNISPFSVFHSLIIFLINQSFSVRFLDMETANKNAYEVQKCTL